MKKKYKILFTLLVLASIATYILIQHVLPYAILQPQRVEGINELETKNVPFAIVDLTSFDSISLKGYHVKSLIDTTYASLILVHGIGGCKEHFTNLSIHLAKLGYDSWIFDNRAHGKSGGEFSTYGYLEKKDISIIINNIYEKTPNTRVGIWGNSLGGAIAIQALEYDKRLAFGIIESTFTDLRQIVYDYQARYSFNIRLKWMCNLTLDKASKITDFNPDKVKPILSVKEIDQPVLIAHGNADKNIKYEYGVELFNNLKSNKKEFVTVENAGHYNLFKAGGEDYENKVFNFLKKHTTLNEN